MLHVHLTINTDCINSSLGHYLQFKIMTFTCKVLIQITRIFQIFNRFKHSMLYHN